MNQKNLFLTGIGVLILVTIVAYFMAVKKPENPPAASQVNPPGETTVQGQPTAQTIPTRTAEEIEVIAQIKDYNVDIENNAFVPATITIKTNDQVFWTNKDSLPHKVKGDNWGGVQINSNEKFVQSFDKPGTYSYSCLLHPDMKGTIIVE